MLWNNYAFVRFIICKVTKIIYHGFIFTFALKDIESGSLKHWQTKAAPDVAIRYWKLPVSLKPFEQFNWNSEKNLYDIFFFV